MPTQKYTELEHFLKSKTPALNVFDDDISATRMGDNKVTIYDVEKTSVRGDMFSWPREIVIHLVLS